MKIDDKLMHRLQTELLDGVSDIRSGKAQFDEDMARFLPRIQDEVP